MKHLDLFSGIGGFSLACEWAGIETILFCENDKFCQKVLNKHWPDVPIVEDVNDKEEIKRIVTDTQNLLGYGGNDNTGICTQRETLPESGNGGRQSITANAGCIRQTQRKEQAAGIIKRDEVTTDTAEQGLQKLEYHTRRNAEDETENGTRMDNRLERPDSLLLTAGFPCQPFSGAGKRKGSDDDRYLWPQTLSVIESIKPDWVILENVAGLLSMVFPDNETNVANQTSLFGNQENGTGSMGNDRRIREYDTIIGTIMADLESAGYETVWLVIPACSVGAPHRRDRVWIVANTTGDGFTRGRQAIKVEKGLQQESGNAGELEGRLERPYCTFTDSQGIRLERSFEPGNEERQEPGNKHSDGLRGTIHDWRKNWYEVAAEFCRVDARVSNRVDRIKSLGNAIVPQVAYQIIKAITEIENASR